MPVVAVLVVALLVPVLIKQLPVYAETIDAPTCATGDAVPDVADNPGLVSDCGALLLSRDMLAGAATLNWSADLPIVQWDGITVEGTPERVTKLMLQKMGLNGEIPGALGSLSNLTILQLAINELTGEIPAELGSLSDLYWLELRHNQLTGEIPAELGNLSNLEHLHFGSNHLDGEIPSELFSSLATLMDELDFSL